MTIQIFNDYHPDAFLGGTELFVKRISTDLANLGHEVKIFHKDTFHMMDFDKPIVYFNIGTVWPLNWEKISKSKYIKVEMDYNFCISRNLIQCKENGCLDAEHLLHYGQIIQNASLNVYLSAAHRQAYRQLFGDAVNNSLLVHSFYHPLEEYLDFGWRRIPNSVIFAARLNREKGPLAVIQYALQNPTKTVYVAGEGVFAEILGQVRNIQVLGKIDPKAMPSLYNLMEEAISAPEWLDPGPVSIVEAILCGCKPIVNENNLILSWGLRGEELRKHIQLTHIKLIESIEKLERGEI